MTTSSKKSSKKRTPSKKRTASKRYTDRRVLDEIASVLGVAPVKSEFNSAGRLIELDYSGSKIKKLPPEINRLEGLRILNLEANKLSSLSPEIFQFPDLQELRAGSNGLQEIPADISLLKELQVLSIGLAERYVFEEDLSREEEGRTNNITVIPPQIGELKQLQYLEATYNRLVSLPVEIGELTNLKALLLGHNQLERLPAEIGQLHELEGLYLHNNRLSNLPNELSHLKKLKTLMLARNDLRRIPTQLGNLTQLNDLDLSDNPELLTPPAEIVSQGFRSTLSFLRELQSDCVTRHEAKMLLVGEGGTGKSSLLRKLRRDTSEEALLTTHGIEVSRYGFKHPAKSNTEVVLNTWDFGGQEIYHATHQFFLTKRSLYLVVWNARLGAEQGRLNYWLDTIKALAPKAPVLLVATHIDERPPDINYPLYKSAYPQLAGNLSVSNLTGAGIEELRSAIGAAATSLPLMDQPWPSTWVETEKSLLEIQAHHINFSEYIDRCKANGVDATIAQGTLGEWLHDLGKILYFRDDFVLSNLIVLKPNWVTKAISQVLTDEQTGSAMGILTHSDLPRIWSKDGDGESYEPYLYPIFLRLMERFDLSYQIEADTPGDHPTRSLVPQLLPHQPPVALPPWPQTPQINEALLEMSYRLAFVPAGIMSWFIVRTHPYTQGLHWREGVFLVYENHDARVELNPMLREIRLYVSGVQPHNFFTILKNTIDLILARFEGLSVARLVPCICHREEETSTRCSRFYRYEDLVKRMEARRDTIECPDSFDDVSVPALLYGIHRSTDDQVMDDIRRGQEEMATHLQKLDRLDLILEKLNQQSELIARNFTRQWNLELQKLDIECPSTFWLASPGRSGFNPKDWVSKQYKLYLMCQHPQAPHTVGNGYVLRQPDVWWKEVAPWLNQLVRFLKFAVPMGKALGAVHDEAEIKKMETRIDLMTEITKAIPSLKEPSDENSLEQAILGVDQFATGSALRSLHTYLDQVDPSHTWGGLARAITPDGNILWLCDLHRRPFEAKALVLTQTGHTP